MQLSSSGLTVDVPRGWEGEVYRRRPDALLPLGLGRETTHAVVHIGNFPLPSTRGDFGSGAVEIMRSEDVLVILFEHDPASASTRLFEAKGIPTVRSEDFDPNRMQRPLPAQSGAQYFFQEGDRAFCLYVVLGSHARRAELVPQVNQVLAGVTIAPR